MVTTVQFDDELVELLRDEHEPVEETAREMIVLELYRRGSISGGKAAELLAMNRYDFIKLASSLNIPCIDMTQKEWEREMRVIDSL